MILLLLVFRSLRQHLLSTVITALSIALAGGLLMSVWVVKVQSESAFTRMNIGFDAVLGAIFASFPNPAGGSYVSQATLTLNGSTLNVTIGAGQVPTLSPAPAINVVGV